jgi:polyphosphate kinase
VCSSDLKQDLIDTFEIGWKANVKARLHSDKFENLYRKRGEDKVFRAQQEMYKHYQNKLEVILPEII